VFRRAYSKEHDRRCHVTNGKLREVELRACVAPVPCRARPTGSEYIYCASTR